MGGAVVYIVWLAALFGAAMGLYYGLRAVKLIWSFWYWKNEYQKDSNEKERMKKSVELW